MTLGLSRDYQYHRKQKKAEEIPGLNNACFIKLFCDLNFFQSTTFSSSDFDEIETCT